MVISNVSALIEVNFIVDWGDPNVLFLFLWWIYKKKKFNLQIILIIDIYSILNTVTRYTFFFQII